MKVSKKKLVMILGILILSVLAIMTGISYNEYKNAEWYEKYPIISHAGGAIGEVSYTNSKEAFENSLAKGHKVFEVDFLYTSDNHLVARHNWNDEITEGFSRDNKPDYETFMNTKIYDMYTPLSVENIIGYMEKNKDIYVVTDIKEKDYVSVLNTIVDTAKANSSDYKNILDRFVIQFYKYDQIDKIKSVEEFDKYILTLYRIKEEDRDFEKISKFCVENDVKVLTIPRKSAVKENIDIAKAYGLYTYTHTINSGKGVIKFEMRGIHGVYTDSVSPLRNSFPIYLLRKIF